LEQSHPICTFLPSKAPWGPYGPLGVKGYRQATNHGVVDDVIYQRGGGVTKEQYHGQNGTNFQNNHDREFKVWVDKVTIAITNNVTRRISLVAIEACDRWHGTNKFYVFYDKWLSDKVERWRHVTSNLSPIKNTQFYQA
jgi:hypothetical protein